MTSLFSTRKLATLFAVMAAVVIVPQMARASVMISTDPYLGTYDIEARARNGRTGYEAVLFTPGNPSTVAPTAATTLDPTGAPVWSANTLYSFSFAYAPKTGTATWNIDFNRDGDFKDNEEEATSVSPTLIGMGFKIANLYIQGNGQADISVQNFTINGTNLGPFTTVGGQGNTVSKLFKDTAGLMTDILVTGQLSFSRLINPQEIPRMWIRFGDVAPIPVVVASTTVVPLPGAVWFLGSALAGIGALARRKRQAARAA